MAHDVFISHSSKDKAVADAVCATLEQHGIRCWIAPRDISPGEDWDEAIVDGIRACRVLVLVFSPHSNESMMVKKEVGFAVSNNVTIIPLRIEDVMPSSKMVLYLDSVHWLDALSQPLEEHLERLTSAVGRVLNKVRIAPTEEELVARLPAPLQDIYQDLKRRALAFGPQVRSGATKSYLKFEAPKVFAIFNFAERAEAFNVQVCSDQFDIAENATAIIHGIEVLRKPDAYGPQKYFFRVDEGTDLLAVENLLRQSYESVSR